MDFIILLFSLGLMGTVCSLPAPACEPNCKLMSEYRQPDFKHVSELQHSSIAPWNLSLNAKAGREPQVIQYAECKDCIVKDMIAKPIILQVSVYEMVRNGTGYAWCKCPFNLAVGCTCVKQ